MKTPAFILSALIAPLLLFGCNKSDFSAASSTKPATSNALGKFAASAAPAAPASASPPSTSRLTATNGDYELAEFIAHVMVDQPSNWKGATRGLVSRDYNYFKEFVRDIKFVGAAQGSRMQPSSVTLRGLKTYTGTIGLSINGKRAIVENVEDDYKWTVYFGGPEVAATSMELSADKNIKDGLGNGAAYFRQAGFTLAPIACDAMGEGFGNNSAVYSASFPGKIPALLAITSSAGSGGQSMTYALFLNGMDWRDTPGLGQSNSGLADMGDCRINPDE